MVCVREKKAGGEAGGKVKEQENEVCGSGKIDVPNG